MLLRFLKFQGHKGPLSVSANIRGVLNTHLRRNSHSLDLLVVSQYNCQPLAPLFCGRVHGHVLVNKTGNFFGLKERVTIKVTSALRWRGSNFEPVDGTATYDIQLKATKQVCTVYYPKFVLTFESADEILNPDHLTLNALTKYVTEITSGREVNINTSVYLSVTLRAGNTTTIYCPPSTAILSRKPLPLFVFLMLLLTLRSLVLERTSFSCFCSTAYISHCCPH